MAPRKEERTSGVTVAHGGLMRAGNAAELPSADLRGARVLTLLVDDGGTFAEFSATVARHGAVFRKIGKPNKRMSW